MVKLGDSVVVKPGVRDADFDVDIGGWQGRVVEIKPGEGILVVHWDSVVLREMPAEMIEECVAQGLSWTLYHIGADEVAPTGPRDTEADVDQAVKALQKKQAWAWIGPEGRAIRGVLAGVDTDDEYACMKAWEEHLKEHLTFPFEAEVDEYQNRGPLQAGDRVTVKRTMLTDDLYGVIVRVTRGRRQYDFHLCDLAALDERSPNHDLVQVYRVWFANR